MDRSARGIVHGIDAEPQPVEDAIGASRLEVLATGEVPAPIEMADDAALAASLSRAGIVADRIAVPAATSVAPAAAPDRQADGSYRFENRLRFWILGRRR